MSRHGFLKLINQKWWHKKTPNLYREHDQDVSNDSDQTQRSSHQDDEYNLHSCVRTLREEAGIITAGVGSVGWIQSLHTVCLLDVLFTGASGSNHICKHIVNYQSFFFFYSVNSLLFWMHSSVCTVTDASQTPNCQPVSTWQVLRVFLSLTGRPRCERWTGE